MNAYRMLRIAAAVLWMLVDVWLGQAAAQRVPPGPGAVPASSAAASASSAAAPAEGAAAASGPATNASAPPGGTATLYVLNASGATLFPSNQNLTDNGQPLASLPRQTWVKLRIAPGRHEFRFKAFPQGKRVAELDAQPGGTYYLAAAYSPGKSWAFPLGGDPLSIRMLDADQARELMQGMREQAP